MTYGTLIEEADEDDVDVGKVEFEAEVLFMPELDMEPPMARSISRCSTRRYSLPTILLAPFDEPCDV